MVKRKKVGICIAEDEKHDEGSSANPKEGEKPTESTLELSGVQSPQNSTIRTRIHITRTSTKEVQSTSEAVEVESAPSTIVDKCGKILTGQRTSNRIPKRIRKDNGDSTLKKIVTSVKQSAPPVGSKTKRPWELWSVEDKNAFFEALCEYGKDFESIQSYIAQRSKKKGTPANMIKNKNQVRHFYYRTWHKISKFLEIGEDVRKQTQELYGLINYAELRKKIGGCLNEKNRQKLNELVFNGVTTVKYKGKKLRIKTPVCRALKKLNNVAEPKEPEGAKLPKDIVVELRPCSNLAWLHVQNLAQNPRVRTKLSLQRRLKSVIEYLQQRWKPYRLKRKEQVLSCLPVSAISSLSNHDPPPVLRVKPKKSATISHLTISAMDNASSSDVCLEKHMKISREQFVDKDVMKTKKGSRLKPKLPSDISGQEFVQKNEQNLVPRTLESQNSAVTQIISESISKDCDKNSIEENYSVGILTPPKSVPEQDDFAENPVDEAQRSLSLLTSMLNPAEKEDPVPDSNEEVVDKNTEDRDVSFFGPECKTIEEMYLNTNKDSENLTLGQLLGLNFEKQLLSPEPEVIRTDDGGVKSLEEKQICDDNVNKCDEISSEEIVKNGWTIESAGLLTLGELYLMLGRPAKILLEYEFEHPEAEICENSSNDESVNKVDSYLSEKDSAQLDTDISRIMKKLIQVAGSMFVEFKNKQTPLSPTSRNIGHARVNNASQSAAKTNSRNTSKSGNVKAAVKAKVCNTTEKANKESIAPNVNKVPDVMRKEIIATSSELCSTTNSIPTSCSDNLAASTDKHVFVVPVGAAPRSVKPPNQESLREEIDKLLPGTRRGCRVRRKPLVVQRPLLPREGMGTMSGPRPMTVVHLVPSGSQLTAVLPSSCTNTDSKPNISATKKVVKILSSGTGIDVRPLHVPLIKQVNHETSHNVILQPSSMSAAHLMVAPATSQSIKKSIPLSASVSSPITTVSTGKSIIEDHSVIIQPAISAQSAVVRNSSLPSSVGPLTLNILSPVTECSAASLCDKIISSPPQISIPETISTSSSLSPGNISSFMEISLSDDFGLSKSRSSEQLSQGISSCLSTDPVVAPKENTPPQSPPNPSFRVNSPGPEAQWLNGESVEFSLNTLLNTLESPCKILPVSSSVNIAAENSNLDPIARLAPVVDSQVRCLLDECSIDFIAKFEDLADVINSSNADSKQT